VQNFSAAPWVKFGDTGHAPIQLHTSNQQRKIPFQMTAVVSSVMPAYFSKNKQANLKNKPKMGNLTEKQTQRAFGRKVQKNIKLAG